MKLIKPTVRNLTVRDPEVINNIDHIWHDIADAAHVCYASDESKDDFDFVCNVLVKNDHARPLEFGSVYLQIPIWDVLNDRFVYKFVKRCYRNELWAHIYRKNFTLYISTSVRMIYECTIDNSGGRWWLMYGSKSKAGQRNVKTFNHVVVPIIKKYHKFDPNRHNERFTFEYECSRGCGDDFRTHVGLSSVMQSTRYCNYSKDKFGNDVTYVAPYFMRDNPRIVQKHKDNDARTDVEMLFDELTSRMNDNSKAYLDLVEKGCFPQEAKNMLGLGVKTVLRQCGFMSEWMTFRYRRANWQAYPECEEIANDVCRLMREMFKQS